MILPVPLVMEDELQGEPFESESNPGRRSFRGNFVGLFFLPYLERIKANRKRKRSTNSPYMVPLRKGGHLHRTPYQAIGGE